MIDIGDILSVQRLFCILFNKRQDESLVKYFAQEVADIVYLIFDWQGILSLYTIHQLTSIRPRDYSVVFLFNKKHRLFKTVFFVYRKYCFFYKIGCVFACYGGDVGSRTQVLLGCRKTFFIHSLPFNLSAERG